MSSNCTRRTGLRNRLEEVIANYENMFSLAKANSKGELDDETVKAKMKEIRKSRKQIDRHNKAYIKASALEVLKTTDFLSYDEDEQKQGTEQEQEEEPDDEPSDETLSSKELKELSLLIDQLDSQDHPDGAVLT